MVGIQPYTALVHGLEPLSVNDEIKKTEDKLAFWSHRIAELAKERGRLDPSDPAYDLKCAEIDKKVADANARMEDLLAVLMSLDRNRS